MWGAMGGWGGVLVGGDYQRALEIVDEYVAGKQRSQFVIPFYFDPGRYGAPLWRAERWCLGENQLFPFLNDAVAPGSLYGMGVCYRLNAQGDPRLKGRIFYRTSRQDGYVQCTPAGAGLSRLPHPDWLK